MGQRVLSVQDVLNRIPGTAKIACDFIGDGRSVEDIRDMRSANLWMLAVPDSQIAAVAHAVASASEGYAVSTAFHCSGALGADQLAPLAALGWHTASAHPILSFATAEAACAQFANTPCALEGHPAARALLQDAFSAIGAQCFEVRSQDKLLYHAAAVFATNFLPVLQSVAEGAWRATGVPEALLPHLRASLLHNAVANITRLGPQGALTGPAARGDTAAIARQAAAVGAWDEKSGAAYVALSDLALRLAGHTPPAMAPAHSGHAPPSPSADSAALL
jgi:predicted short-subunit dehydrogenase-like oxidoreductase (DUF2520 family)